MSYNIRALSALQQIVNTYLEEQGHLATGKVQVEYLGLKKAKDLVEFIQLNLRHLAG